MAENFYTILTATGKAKLANSAVLGSKVNFKTLKVGDGKGVYYEPSENQTSLVNQVWSGNISSISVDESNHNWIVIETIIPATIGGFFIREAGIFDEDGDLIAISKISETYKPVVAEGSIKDLCIKIILEVSNVESVTLKIDSTIILAKKSDVDELKAEINTQLSDMTNDRIYYCGTTSGTNTYAATNSKITAYKDGLTVRIKIGATSTGASTLNINGLGEKTILDTLGNSITSGGLKAGLPYQLCYNGTNFIVLGKGGGGNVTADKMLLGITATGDGGPVVGTILSKGSATYNPSTADQVIVAGQYLSGPQTIKGDTNLKASNIINGKSIFGIVGTAVSSDYVAGDSFKVFEILDPAYYDPNKIPKYLPKNITNTNYELGISRTCYNVSGIVRVTFGMTSNGKELVYGRIYVNGIPRGIERTTQVDYPMSYFTEDIQVNSGDSIQIYCKTGHTNGLSGVILHEIKITCGNNFGYFA